MNSGKRIAAFALFVIGASCALLYFSSNLPSPASSAQAAQGIEGQVYTTPKSPLVSIKKSAPSTLEFKVEGIEFRAEDISAEGVAYKRIRMSDCGYAEDIGEPELPYIRKLIAIPECSSVNVAAKAASTVTVSGIDIYPVPRKEFEPSPTADGMSMREVFSRNKAAYANDAVLHSEIVRVASIFKIRNQRVAELHIYPMQYNPARREAFISRDIDVTVTYESASGPVSVPTGPFENVCKGILLNYDFGSYWVNRSSEKQGLASAACSGNAQWYESLTAMQGTDYLIIVGHDLAESAQSKAYIDSLAGKRAEYNCYNVSLIDVQDILGHAAGPSDGAIIRDSLVSFYARNVAPAMGDSKLGYILLVGDVYICGDQDCTIKTTILPLANTSNPTDIPYASLASAGDQTHPSVFIGRLSVDDTGENNAFIGKIVGYEPIQESPADAWYEKALYIVGEIHGEGGALQYSSLSDIANVTPSEYTLNYIEQADRGTAVVSQEICDSLNSGALFVNMVGHGMEYYWGNTFVPKYYDDSSKLHNTGKYPVIFALSCLTGRYDTPCDLVGCCHPSMRWPTSNLSCYDPAAPTEVDSFDCMGERITSIAGRGAVAYIGFSRSASALCETNIEVQKQFFYSGYSTIGEIFVASYYHLNSSFNQSIFVHLGDPALNPFYVEAAPPDTSRTDLAIELNSVTIEPPIFDADGLQTVGFTVRNADVEDAGNIDVAIVKGAETIWESTITSLEGYHDTTFAASLSETQTGSSSITIRVNPSQTIPEYRYYNNDFDTVITVMDIKSGFPLSLSEDSVYPAPITGQFDAANAYKEILLNNSSGLKLYSHNGQLKGEGNNFSFRAITPMGDIQAHNAKNVITASILTDYIQELVQLTLYNAANLEAIPIGNSTFLRDGATQPAYKHLGLYDLDQDGNSEIVLSYGTWSSGRLTVYGCEGGNFIQIANADLTIGPVAIAIEDVNNDNKAEICIFGFDYESPNWLNIVQIFNLNGTSLDLIKTDSVIGYPLSEECLVLADVNGDAYQDVVGLLGHTIRVLSGKGEDNFSVLASLTIENVTGTLTITPSDLDADGAADIVLVNGGTLSVLEYQTGSLVVTDTVTIDDGAAPANRALTSDIDGDGSLEIIVGEGILDPPSFRIGVYDSDLNKVSSALSTMLSGITSGKLAIDDLDCDGKQDVVLQTNNELYAFNVPWSSSGKADWNLSTCNVHNTAVRSRYLKGSGYDLLSLWGNVEVVGDVTADSTVSVDAGTSVLVRASDVFGTGDDTLKCELDFYDTCSMVGTAIEGISFESAAAQPQAGDWYGMWLRGAASGGTLSYCDISHAKYGLKSESTVQMSNCDVRYCSLLGVYITGSSNASSLSACNITYNTTTDAKGLMIETSGSGVEVASCNVNNNYYGIWISSASPTIEGTTARDNTKNGIHVTKTTGQPAGNPTISLCNVRSNDDNGIYWDNAGGTLSGTTVWENTNRGVKLNNADISIEESSIHHNYTDISCTSSCPVIRYTGIYKSHIGVATTDKYSVPDLGTAADHGNNNFGPTTSLVNDYNLTAVDPEDDIYAQYNWWGTKKEAIIIAKIIVADGPPPGCGTVIYSPFLYGPPPLPGSEQPEEQPEIPNATYLAQNYPNPFNPSTTIRFGLSEAAAISVKIYNVSGSLVRVIVDGRLAAGFYEKPWDGKDLNGRSVSSGVYFCRMQTGSKAMTKKMVLLR